MRGRPRDGKDDFISELEWQMLPHNPLQSSLAPGVDVCQHTCQYFTPHLVERIYLMFITTKNYQIMNMTKKILNYNFITQQKYSEDFTKAASEVFQI